MSLTIIRPGGGAAAGGGVWVFIAETILGAPAATVTFAAIPGTYRTLALFYNVKSSANAAVDTLAYRVNADAGANYDHFVAQFISTGLSAAPAYAQTLALLAVVDASAATGSSATEFSTGLAYWPFYAGVVLEKKAMGMRGGLVQDKNAATDMRMSVSSSLWNNTAAITSLTFLLNTGPNFVAGCQFTLYGIT